MSEDRARQPYMDAPIRYTSAAMDIANIVVTMRMARWAYDIPIGIKKLGLRPA